MSTDDRHLVERMTWNEVARRIDAGAAAILPIGAAAKQHGLHLPLNTDRIQAEWLAARLAESIDALIWPTLTYGHYPAFVEYAGSTSLSAPVFEAMVQQIASGILGQRLPCAVRARHRDQHESAGRARAGAARRRQCAAFADSRWTALSPRRGRTRRAAPRQPCRRARDIADAGARAASGRHEPRRSEPATAHASAGPPDADRHRLAELQPLRQFWRSDAGDSGQGRDAAQSHARRSQRAGIGLPRSADEGSRPIRSVSR